MSGKRALTLLLVLLAVGTRPAAAQELTGGLKGGLTIATIPDFATAVGEPGLDTGSRIGLAVGGFVAFPVVEQLDIQPEFFYVQKGLSFDGSAGQFGGDGTVKLDYIEIPVLAVYRFAPDRSRTGYVLFGPAFAFNTTAKVDVGSGDDVDVDDEVKGSEFSLVLGGGVTFGRFLAEARWTEGLTAVNDQSVLLEEDVRNRAVTILVGVRF
jgi:Outer membrane protein beta-barrel domain